MSDTDDRRAEERSECDLEAMIELADGVKVPCLVTDLSTTGTRIELDDAITLPDTFDLLVPAVPGADQRFKVVVRWREAGIVGGEFLRDDTIQ